MTADMKTVPIDSANALEMAVELLRRGQVIAFPTDTVYGVGALLADPRAVERLRAVKHRSLEKPIPVLLAGWEQVASVASEVTPQVERLCHRFWPGPLTVVVPAAPGLPRPVSPRGSIGLRVPDHELIRRLIDTAGPMAATSANLSGGPTAVRAAEVRASLEGRIELILDGGPAPGGTASTVVEIASGEILVHREGPIGKEEIHSLLRD